MNIVKLLLARACRRGRVCFLFLLAALGWRFSCAGANPRPACGGGGGPGGVCGRSSEGGVAFRAARGGGRLGGALLGRGIAPRGVARAAAGACLWFFSFTPDRIRRYEARFFAGGGREVVAERKGVYVVEDEGPDSFALSYAVRVEKREVAPEGLVPLFVRVPFDKAKMRHWIVLLSRQG